MTVVQKFTREPALFAILSYFLCGSGWLIMGTLSDDRASVTTFILAVVGFASATVGTGYCARRCVRLTNAAAVEHAEHRIRRAEESAARAWDRAREWQLQTLAAQESLDVSQANLASLMDATARRFL